MKGMAGRSDEDGVTQCRDLSQDMYGSRGWFGVGCANMQVQHPRMSKHTGHRKWGDCQDAFGLSHVYNQKVRGTLHLQDLTGHRTWFYPWLSS